MVSSVEYLFICLLDIYISSLEKILSCSSVHFLLCFFFVFFFFLDVELYGLFVYFRDTYTLWIISFANIFSHSVDSFGFLIVSFVMKKLLSLIRSRLFIFAFIFFALGDGYQKKKIIAMIYVKECSVYVFL